MARKSKNKREPRFEKNKILIICQGETEYNYFDKFRILLGEKILIDSSKISKRPSIKPKLNHESPKRVVEFALKEKTSDCLSVWCVFDKDEFVDFEDAIRLANKNNIKCAYSNKDFELWFLYHFKKQTVPIQDKNCKNEISKFIKKPYSKTDKKLYDYFEENMEKAINNAKIRHQESLIDNKNKLYGLEPCTTVYELVEYLNKFK